MEGLIWDLMRRVAAIEARQRAQGTHDPDCARTKAMVALGPDKHGFVWRHQKAEETPCDCWLSREPS